MSKKKLVVSGDSWTAGSLDSRENGHVLEFPLWPEYFGEMLNMDVINVSFVGKGNEFIYNSIVDKLAVYAANKDFH